MTAAETRFVGLSLLDLVHGGCEQRSGWRTGNDAEHKRSIYDHLKGYSRQVQTDANAVLFEAKLDKFSTRVPSSCNLLPL